MTTDSNMKRGDLEPALTLIAEDEDQVADLRSVSSWRILGVHAGRLMVDDAPDEVVIDDATPWKATLTRQWQAGDTDVTGQMRFEAEAMWPDERPQTFPAAGTASVWFHADLG